MRYPPPKQPTTRQAQGIVKAKVEGPMMGRPEAVKRNDAILDMLRTRADLEPDYCRN